MVMRVVLLAGNQGYIGGVDQKAQDIKTHIDEKYTPPRGYDPADLDETDVDTQRGVAQKSRNRGIRQLLGSAHGRTSILIAALVVVMVVVETEHQLLNSNFDKLYNEHIINCDILLFTEEVEPLFHALRAKIMVFDIHKNSDLTTRVLGVFFNNVKTDWLISRISDG